MKYRLMYLQMILLKVNSAYVRSILSKQTTELYHTLPFNNGKFAACEYSFETNRFCHASMIFFLSLKDLEKISKIFINVKKNLFAPQTCLLKKLALIILYNFHHEHSLLKSKIKF